MKHNKEEAKPEQKQDAIIDDINGPLINKPRGECHCDPEEQCGETSVMCCNRCGEPTEDFWRKPEQPEAESQEQNTYQLCPKCHGQGTVCKPPWVAGDIDRWDTATAMNHVCGVCNGAKIIARPKH